MRRNFAVILSLLFLCSSSMAQYGSGPTDESLSIDPDLDYIRTSYLPGGPSSNTISNLDEQMTHYNSRELPELSSGVIATTVYNESMFFSGIYRQASADGKSFVTKVRIPNYAMFRFNRTDDDEQQIMKRSFYYNYTYGLWEETIDTPKYYIRSVMGTHAYYSRTFFHAIEVVRKNVLSYQVPASSFDLSSYHVKLLEDGKFTEDLNIVNTQIKDLAAESTYGSERTLNINGAADQSESSVVVLTNSHLMVNQRAYTLGIPFQANQAEYRAFYIQTVAPSSERTDALNEYKEVLNKQNDIRGLLDLHKQRWDERYRFGDIEMKGTGTTYAKLRRMARTALHTIYGQFPFADRYGATTSGGTDGTGTTNADKDFHGVSACGLGRGGNSTRTARVDFAGHVTPDQEQYLFQLMALLQPELAQQMLLYRVSGMQSSPPVPFESARSGSSVDPVYCQHCQTQAVYPTGLLGLAVRHYFAATRDETWLKEASSGGMAIMDKVVQYLDSKIQQNTSRGDWYGISGVCGPDELHENQNNNLFTNALASLAVNFWYYLKCLDNQINDQSVQTSIDHARKLYFPFDHNEQRNEQYEGYFTAAVQEISQPDAMLTYFPAYYNMSGRWLEQAQPRRLEKDMSLYSSRWSSSSGLSSASTPPGVWLSLKAITQMQVGTSSKLNEGKASFDLLLQYASQPFHVWRNLTQERYDNAASGHIATAASFLNALFFGFGGLRLDVHRLDILRPSLPTEVTEIKFTGINFFGGEMDYTLTDSNIAFTQTPGGTSFKTSMTMIDRIQRQFKTFSGSGSTAVPAFEQFNNLDSTLSSALFSIVTDTNFNCELYDRNYNSHNPYYQGASSQHASLFVLVTAALIAKFFC